MSSKLTRILHQDPQAAPDSFSKLFTGTSYDVLPGDMTFVDEKSCKKYRQRVQWNYESISGKIRQKNVLEMRYNAEGGYEKC